MKHTKNIYKKKTRRSRLFIVLLLLLSLGAVFAFWLLRKTIPLPAVPPEPEPVVLVDPAEGAGRGRSSLTLISSNAILFDPASGETLYVKNADQRVYPASLTKLMTALIAVEQIEDFDMPVTLQYDDYVGLYEQNAAMAGFTMGETVTARDLLYATLLPSGAEAACALARAAAGSQEECIALMNERASALGMKNSHFTNVTGLHDPEHYTTVSDLSLLLKTALQSQTFSTAFSSFRYITTVTEQHPEGLLLSSTLVPRLNQLDRAFDPITGAKTGYTEEAQLCLASIAERGGVRRAIITVGAKGDGQSQPTHLEDAYLLYEKSLPH